MLNKPNLLCSLTPIPIIVAISENTEALLLQTPIQVH